MEHKTLAPQQGFFPQPIYLIGTKDSLDNVNFAPVTWITSCSGTPPKIMIAMTKEMKTCENILKTRRFSANLATTKMHSLVNYLGAVSGHTCFKCREGQVPYYLSTCTSNPILTESPWVYECETMQEIELETTFIFIADVICIHTDSTIKNTNYGQLDINELEPIIYSPWKFYSLGNNIGEVK